MRLRLTEILDFYDVPQVFVAADAVGTSYLCLFYDYDENGRQKCISVTISKERLNDFVTGHLDLRSIFLEPEMSCYDVIVEGGIIEACIRHEVFTDNMLPDEGFYLDYSLKENHEMVMTSQEEGHPIIRLAFNHDTNNHTIASEVLVDTIQNFQALLRKAYKRVSRSRDTGPSQLFVKGTIAASFDLELVASESNNLFGGSRVADTLEMLSPLFGDEDEEVANCLATFRDIQSNYKNMMKSLSEKELSFKCKWVQNTMSGVVNDYPISQERIHSLYVLASNLELLQERERVFEGVFFMANVRNGKWGFAPIGNERRKYGVCLEENMLGGIVLQNRLYRINCIEKPSQNPNTGATYTTYVLNEIRLVEQV